MPRRDNGERWWIADYAKNKVRIKESQRKWNAKNPDELKAIAAKWWAENKERVAAQRKERRDRMKLENPEAARAAQRERFVRYYAKHRDRILQKQRDERPRTKYKMPVAEHRAMLAAQGGKCSICREVPTGAKGLFIDHCHDTGVVRGLICNHCNRGLGGFRDNTESLWRAIAYLNASRRKSEVA